MLRTALAVLCGALLATALVTGIGMQSSRDSGNSTQIVSPPVAVSTENLPVSVSTETKPAETDESESDAIDRVDDTAADVAIATDVDATAPSEPDALALNEPEDTPVAAEKPAAAPKRTLSAAQKTAMAEIKGNRREILDVNRSIWDYAEVGLQETKSSALLISKLRAHGFEVQGGVADMPTAFVASFGSGRPIIGILAEYDALPGMSQKVAPQREPVNPGEPGHACGHSGLGAGALGAAVAIKRAIEKHELQGTIRLYGTPAEETVIGKVYMLLGGAFDDLDLCLHWHPSTRNEVWSGSSKSLISAKFTFSGTAAHASVSPEQGRSALDAVELMNAGVNYMREHVKDDARIHYVITNGGAAPNVIPATATVWYYVRADLHSDAAFYYSWILDIAKGASLMTRTEVSITVDTDCHELIPNTPLSEVLYDNLHLVSPPTFDEQEHQFARRLQLPLSEEFGIQFEMALDESIHAVNASMDAKTGSTDVGDVSWYVPTGGIRTTCFPAESPGHSWQNVASIGSSIGEKGIVYAANVLAISAVQLFENPEFVAAAKADWQQRMQGRQYTTLIPAGQKAPTSIR